ncbi:lysine 2,3-aminomutase YodO family protein [Desulfotomaculum nigrificans CO-1-SRB]|uniref:Lysine 2,3-aminomutase YodO family protein n=1 Tax=Desulfotomaculum nigrificans (strain DSM 14880 / VKM B-2319 / CO-1-SRB) TaxID=868595 RepID=F6B6L1_DESCC|nr:glutamate 2,3-aminomutase [Desulfotomaculum nigrificans]AEF94385.1 lysine 2,3-aminomutase YodO family protein [Desulfotomaculum nigrificans CO-1-SRB]
MSVNLKQEGQWLEQEKRNVALKRARELKSRIKDYLDNKQNIPNGFEKQAAFAQAKEKILQYFGASEEQWDDWRWQMANRIKDVQVLGQLMNLSAEDMNLIDQVGQHYRWAVSPYYLALVIISGLTGPIGKQAIPSIKEIEDHSGVEDPMGEEFTSPAPAITRRYPDRLIINVTNQCAMYCRHCQRRRNIGEVDVHKPRKVLQAALDYIRENEEIRDVLITGGDALLLPDKQIDWLLTELDRIPHVEIKRIGTRTPVTMPQRITPTLCAILEKHPPIYINTQFNHPLEVTPEAKTACDRLVKAGVVLGNQAVLLKDINNHPDVMKRLNQSLLQIRVRPYYIFHAKNVKGTGHFITSVEEGIAIMDQLRGYTSGLAVPTYIINAPNGYGKTPILPQYVLDRKDNYITLRTWEKRVIRYPIDGQH